MDTVTDRVTENNRKDMDERFANFERLFERMAQPAPVAQPPVTPAEKRPAEDPAPEPPQRRQTRNVTRQAEDRAEYTSDSSFIDSALPRQPASRTPSATITREATGLAAAGPEVQPRAGVNNNNNNHTWNAWLGMQQPFSSQHLGFSGAQGLLAQGNQSLEDQVRYIMESTPHQLAGKTPSGGLNIPYKYVSRGPEKRRLAFNTVTLAEHIWGMFRMLDDECTDPSIKPFILAHMKEVAEDATEYEWNTHVRRWSEEVFNMIAEKRLPDSWKSTSRIQNLHTGMSRVDGARISSVKDNSQWKYQTQPLGNDTLKGGPPCSAFNSQQGCSLQSGHMTGGVKQIHICSYCLANTAATHPHSEAKCRTKQHHAASHF